ncbi:polysaccharide lyase family 3 [Colletotrichum melonis]|uniref:Pectate lyase n=2 Tax=Colletotrichum acutatum species complex TaxID=2707335 RepID=A0AAI9XRV9_9PEZI|nr:polysaccharide lyase family 3 [Colletotrichum limetticola]KAK1461459.1 polysaccharide lyase family 3 [Colletotrichum melonis]
MRTEAIKFLAALAVVFPTVSACVGKDALPTATETISNTEPIEVAAGESYDGKMARFDRGSGACKAQTEGGQKDTVFLLRKGATLKNAIIGKDQMEGVYCIGGGCTIENVWFEDVCEDAISIKEDEAGTETRIIGGGAYKAADKVVQHNGCGSVSISNFYASDYGKVYRACGTCDACKRTVTIEGVSAYGGGEVAGINEETGDEATLVNVCTDAKTPCQLYNGPGEKSGSC